MCKKTGNSNFNVRLLFCIIITCIVFIPAKLWAQQTASGENKITAGSQIPFGFSSVEWKRFQNNWKRLNYEARIITRDSQISIGQIIGIQNDKLLFWNDPHTFFNPFQIDNSLTSIETGDIIKVSITDNHFNSGGFVRGMVWGGVLGTAGGIVLYVIGHGWIPFYFGTPLVIIGGVAGATIGERYGRNRRDIVPFDLTRDGKSINSPGTLNKYELFPDSLPSSFLKIDEEGRILHRTRFANDISQIITFSPQVRKWSEKKRFNVTFQAGRFDIPSLTPKYPGYIQIGGYEKYSFRIGAGYSISAKFLIEYSYMPAADFHSFDIYGSNYVTRSENYEIKSHSIYFTWLPVRADGFQTRKIELSAGAGFSLNPVLTRSGYFFKTPDGDTYIAGEYFNYYDTKTKPGLMLKTEFDYYLLKWISLNAMVEKSFLPSVSIPEHKQIHPVTGELMGIEAHKVNYSGYSILFGVRFHL